MPNRALKIALPALAVVAALAVACGGASAAGDEAAASPEGAVPPVEAAHAADRPAEDAAAPAIAENEVATDQSTAAVEAARLPAGVASVTAADGPSGDAAAGAAPDVEGAGPPGQSPATTGGGAKDPPPALGPGVHDFTLPSFDGAEYALSSYLGEKNVVIVFYRAFW